MTLELNKIYNMDCIEGLKLLPDNSVDSIVTDPPYELGFMGKSWDSTGIAYNIELWKECLRVLKHGGHLLAFGGTRTYHRMVCAIEDAGFEIRDTIQWIYGSGFPKSHDISKAIDKKLGAEREVIGRVKSQGGRTGKNPYQSQDTNFNGSGALVDITAPATDKAKQWDGWGTALKPANEPIVVARKPLSEKTIVDNVLEWGTGGLNIDDCRVEYDMSGTNPATNPLYRKENGYKIMCGNDNDGSSFKIKPEPMEMNVNNKGRFPANIILDEEAGRLLDKQSGILKSGNVKPEGFKGKYTANVYGKYANNQIDPKTVYADSGGASRFFYCAKASKKERGEGNTHPTVKPLSLIKYLITLVTPPNGICLDPFEGSGTHAIACEELGFHYIGLELDLVYCNIANKRINNLST